MTLHTLAKEVGQLLLAKKWRLVTAESCTGGGLSYYLTSTPGSSQWFECGLITYSNESKMRLLGVQANTLKVYGAVSQETALEMAKGALQYEADISIAITGIAGPLGGTFDKPIGTVWFGYAMKSGERLAEKLFFDGDRETIRHAAIETALKKILRFKKQ